MHRVFWKHTGGEVGLRIMISQNKSHSSLADLWSIIYKSEYWPFSSGHEPGTLPNAKEIEMSMTSSPLSRARICRRQVHKQMIKTQQVELWTGCWWRERREIGDPHLGKRGPAKTTQEWPLSLGQGSRNLVSQKWVGWGLVSGRGNLI